MPDDPGILDLPVPEGEGLYRRLKQAVFLDDPDVRRNPLFKLRLLLYGPRRMERVFALAAAARDVADLGSGSGWAALEIARRNPHARVLAVEKDFALSEWSKEFYQQHGPPGTVEHVCADLESFGLPPLDAVLLLFTLGSLQDPCGLLDRVHDALRPGGLLITMDGTEPPPRNVERLARWLRTPPDTLRARYEHDGVRRHRPPQAPPEGDVFAHLQRRFHVEHESRHRAFIDWFTGRYRAREALLKLPLWKVLDEAALRLGLLDGAVRFVVARRRAEEGGCGLQRA